MRVVVDYDLCEGNARCVHQAPAVFQIDDNDQLHLLIESPTEDQRDAVEAAAAICPRGAIRIEESPAKPPRP